MPYCPECGKENSNDAKVCISCGASIETSRKESKSLLTSPKEQMTNLSQIIKLTALVGGIITWLLLFFAYNHPFLFFTLISSVIAGYLVGDGKYLYGGLHGIIIGIIFAIFYGIMTGVWVNSIILMSLFGVIGGPIGVLIKNHFEKSYK